MAAPNTLRKIALIIGGCSKSISSQGDTMKKIFIPWFMILGILLSGCMEESEPTMDKNLVGTWAYEDAYNLLVAEFSADRQYKYYYMTIFSNNTYCDIFSYGKATTGGGKINFKREGGLVANTVCLNIFLDGGTAADDSLAYTLSGASLTVGNPGSALTLVSATVDPTAWNNPMYGDYVNWLRE